MDLQRLSHIDKLKVMEARLGRTTWQIEDNVRFLHLKRSLTGTENRVVKALTPGLGYCK